jgi:amino acid permease
MRKNLLLGGTIGAGLFVGSGEALVNGDPAAIFICYTIVGFLMLCTMMSLGELAVMYPVNGGYYEYSVRLLDPSWLVTTLLYIPPFSLSDLDADKMNLIQGNRAGMDICY